MVTSKDNRKGTAHFLLDYGPDYHVLWQVFMDDSDESWWVPNPGRKTGPSGEERKIKAMTITAKVIADSVSPQGVRLTTIQTRYPKFIHGELMTHRTFSRNASSSRAIPVARLIQDVMDDPAVPIHWGKNQPGMQAREELTGNDLVMAQREWLRARDHAVAHARMLSFDGVHKQIVNRIIEPFCHVNVVITSTEWLNFYTLRRHPDAMPEMKALADAMWEAQQASMPKRLLSGQWHLPYVTAQDETHELVGIDPKALIKLSVARCARVSYLTHEGKAPDIDADLALYDRLVGSQPLHASPAEHQATPDYFCSWAPPFSADVSKWEYPHQWGNFYGWRQYRKTLQGECVRDR